MNESLRSVATRHCRLSCGLCPAVCEDHNGQMKKMFNGMNCVTLADAGTCNSTDHDGAAFLSALMQTNCRIACGMCSPFPSPPLSCSDNNTAVRAAFGKNCSTMASDGHCYVNPLDHAGTDYLNNLMHEHCPVACRYCTQLTTTPSPYSETPPPGCIDDDVYMMRIFRSSCASMAKVRNACMLECKHRLE